MKRVLYLTWDVKTGEKQPDNVVMIRKWEGDVEDRQLLDMIPVLQMITQTHVADVRDVARAYRGKELPVEFRERVRQQVSGKRRPRGRW